MRKLLLSGNSNRVHLLLQSRYGFDTPVKALEGIEKIYFVEKLEAENSLNYYRFINAFIFFFVLGISLFFKISWVFRGVLLFFALYQTLHFFISHLEYKRLKKKLSDYEASLKSDV